MNAQALKPYSIPQKPVETDSFATLFFLLGIPQIYLVLKNRRLRNQTILNFATFCLGRLLAAGLMTATVATIIEVGLA